MDVQVRLSTLSVVMMLKMALANARSSMMELTAGYAQEGQVTQQWDSAVGAQIAAYDAAKDKAT